LKAALRLDAVSVSLGGRRVVDSVSLTVEEGEWAVVIGPNGAGKTTLLRAIAGLVPHGGTIELLGHPSAALGRRERARLLALVPQLPATPPWLTVAEYVLLGRTPYLRGLSRESRSDLEAAARAIERLDLAEYAERLLGTLSGGERQRVVVARAIAQEAPIVLLDEPTSALDLGYQQQALELLDELRRSGELTLVAAMHDLTLAAQYADRMILLDDGRVVADGAPHDVVTEESIERHYGATTEVVTMDNRLAVIPRRRGQASA
jgi:iron complex transport system ATP-binding protein